MQGHCRSNSPEQNRDFCALFVLEQTQQDAERESSGRAGGSVVTKRSLDANCLLLPSFFLLLTLLTISNLPLSGYPFFGNITVTRECEEECLASDGIGANKPKSCCYTDLCTDNPKIGSGVGSSSPALGLVAMVVGTALRCAL